MSTVSSENIFYILWCCQVSRHWALRWSHQALVVNVQHNEVICCGRACTLAAGRVATTSAMMTNVRYVGQMSRRRFLCMACNEWLVFILLIFVISGLALHWLTSTKSHLPVVFFVIGLNKIAWILGHKIQSDPVYLYHLMSVIDLSTLLS